MQSKQSSRAECGEDEIDFYDEMKGLVTYDFVVIIEVFKSIMYYKH